MTNWIITSSVLILIIIAARKILKGHISPLLQYALWLIVLVRLVVPFNPLESSISILNAVPTSLSAAVSDVTKNTENITPETFTAAPAADSTAAYTEIVISDAPESTASVPAQSGLPSFSFVLGTLWLTGTVMLLIYALIRNYRLARFLHRTRKPYAEGVYVAPALPSSCLFGVLDPVIYITNEVASDAQALRHVLAHEQAHRRHGDHIWNLLRIGVLALHWFNPLVWWACALSKRDAEMAADTAAIATLAPQERFDYGETLLNMLNCAAPRNTWFSCSTTMITTKRALRERIEAIVKNARTAVSMAMVVLLMAAAVVGCTFTGAEDKSGSGESASEEESSYVFTLLPYGHEQIANITRWLKDDLGLTYEDISETLSEWIESSDTLDSSLVTDYYLQKMSDGSMIGAIYYEEDPPTYQTAEQIEQFLSDTSASLNFDYWNFDGDGVAMFTFDRSRFSKYKDYVFDHDQRLQAEQDPRVFDSKYIDPVLNFYYGETSGSKEFVDCLIQWSGEEEGLTYEDRSTQFWQWIRESNYVNTDFIDEYYMAEMSDGTFIGTIVYDPALQHLPSMYELEHFGDESNLTLGRYTAGNSNDVIFYFLPADISADEFKFLELYMLEISINWAHSEGLYD